MSLQSGAKILAVFLLTTGAAKGEPGQADQRRSGKGNEPRTM